MRRPSPHHGSRGAGPQRDGPAVSRTGLGPAGELSERGVRLAVATWVSAASHEGTFYYRLLSRKQSSGRTKPGATFRPEAARPLMPPCIGVTT